MPPGNSELRTLEGIPNPSNMIRHTLLYLAALWLFPAALTGQGLRVSDNGRFLVRENGSPFFWLADTAWELTHKATRDEVATYLEKRHSQGFNVIQTVALAELDGLHTPNREGNTPLFDDDPTRPNPAYFELIDFTLRKADSLGMYLALLPTWGDKLFKNSWGMGPEVFTPENAYAYGKWIGTRYRDAANLVWILGGDRNPREGSTDAAIWNRMAAGILDGVNHPEKALMSFHPQPRKDGGSSHWFHAEPWLDFNMHQTGHCADLPSYLKIQHDYALSPVKPVVDGEPLYEDHPNCFNANELGYSLPRDMRRIMYSNVFAGAFGQTYGCHDVWQWHRAGEPGVNGPLRPWLPALDLPVANQVQHLKNLMLSRPFLSRIPDQGLLAASPEANPPYIAATRDTNGSYAMIYLPQGESCRVDLSRLAGAEFKTWWYDPRTGASWEGPELKGRGIAAFSPPSRGAGNDWVLVIDQAGAPFPPPGMPLAAD